MSKPDQALVPAESKVPALRVAKDLESAEPRMFVHVDRHGQVRSPVRYRVLSALIWATTIGIAASVPLMYGLLFGVPGFAAGAGLTAWIAWRVRPGLAARRALRLIVADQLDAAEAILRTILAKRSTPRAVRSLAHHYQGVLAARRGDYPAALEQQRAALAASRRRSGVIVRNIEYSEILALVNSGRVAEARQLLATRHPSVPKGNYLCVVHWTVDLYICLAEGKHQIAEDDLHQRARTALTITTSAALLGLTAWAHLQLGNDDQAWHLLRETYERLPGMHLDRLMPLLYQWMEAHRAQAGI